MSVNERNNNMYRSCFSNPQVQVYIKPTFQDAGLQCDPPSVLETCSIKVTGTCSCMLQTCLYNFSYKKVIRFLQQPVATEGIRL